GNQIEFGLDFHGRVSAPMAKVLIKELEPYRPLFIEEPVLAEQAEYYPKLAAQTPPSSAVVHLCATDAGSIDNCGTDREFCPCNPIRRHALCCERRQNGYHRS
ncbi:enolase C-terminal domain-like protein, partial [Pseudomonas aeruginosa]|uniref:enolase C-terminal domain-like protein n=1 Tax=Pseudomonas aeruginosa TaxID=287 RepID=UPI0031B70E3F